MGSDRRRWSPASDRHANDVAEAQRVIRAVEQVFVWSCDGFRSVRINSGKEEEM